MATWQKISIGVSLALVLVAGAYVAKIRLEQKAVVVAPVQPPPAGPHSVIVQGRAYCSASLQMTTPAGGDVEQLLVQVGQAVKKDQALLIVKIAANERAQLSAKINTYSVQSSLEMNLQQLEAKQMALTRNLSELKQLVERDFAPRSALIEMQDQFTLVERQLASVRVALQEAQQNRQNDLAGISKLYGQSVSPGIVPKTVILRAPMDGHVIWLAPAARVGAVVLANVPLVTVGVMDPMTIRGQIHESEMGPLKPGETAQITLDAGNGDAFNATLANVSWASQDSAVSAASYYLFELTVNNPELKIKDGNRVQVTFPARQDTNANATSPVPPATPAK